MQPKTIVLAAVLSAAPGLMHAQLEFKIADREVQIHGFASQGFAYSNENNYLTMKTSQGSFAFTDGGVNVSTRLTDRFRIGGQVYVRDVGNLGKWHPQLDWATADYKFSDWFGIRGGVNKTVFGLHNDTQDMEFLHTFALLPQSIYPTDLRDGLIRHTGGDIYGTISAKRLGSFSYTAFSGLRDDSRYGGYLYLLRDRGIFINSYGGLQYGADLRWNTPIKGLLVGASGLKEDITGTGSGTCTPAVPISCAAWLAIANPNHVPGTPNTGSYEEHSRNDRTRQFYAEYTLGKLTVDAEQRRYVRDHIVWNRGYEVWADNRSWYVSGTYRVAKRLELGSYLSRLSSMYQRGSLPPVLNTDGANGHILDRTVTARMDLTRHWNFKVEGHFMDGYNNNQFPGGFYTPDNPQGLKPTTNMLLLRTGWNF
jgi:hypothetical protein